jgi:hypothetical protein
VIKENQKQATRNQESGKAFNYPVHKNNSRFRV